MRQSLSLFLPVILVAQGAQNPAELRQKLTVIQGRLSQVDQQLASLKKRRKGVLVEIQGISLQRDRAKAQVDGWKQRLARLPRPAGKEPVRMFLFDSGEDKPFTAGKFAIATAMMEAAGGRNTMDDVETSWGTVSWEAVAARNPEFLVLLDYQNDGGAGKLLQFLQKHPLMQHTDAVKNQRFVALRYEELTPGPANIGAIEKIAKAALR